MKISTFLFTILLLNLATICVCTNVKGEEGNIPSAENVYSPPTNDNKLEGGEANGIPATVNNENDFDDGFDIDSEDFKEIMATPLTQELIHSNATNLMTPFSSAAVNLPNKSDLASNVVQQYHLSKGKEPIVGTNQKDDTNISLLMDNRRNRDNKTHSLDLDSVPEYRQNEERFMKEKKKRYFSQMLHLNTLLAANKDKSIGQQIEAAKNFGHSFVEQQKQQKQPHQFQFVKPPQKKQKIETKNFEKQSKNHPHKLEYSHPSTIHGGSSQLDSNKNPEFNRQFEQKKPIDQPAFESNPPPNNIIILDPDSEPEKEVQGNTGSSRSDLLPQLWNQKSNQQRRQMIQIQKGETTILSKQQFSHSHQPPQHIPSEAVQQIVPPKMEEELNKKMKANIIANTKVSANLLNIKEELDNNKILSESEKQLIKQHSELYAEKKVLELEGKRLNKKISDKISTESEIQLITQHAKLYADKKVLEAEEKRLKEEISKLKKN